jgi:hypothetical protein
MPQQCGSILVEEGTKSQMGGVEKRMVAVIPATAGIPRGLMPRDSRWSLSLQAVGRGGDDGRGSVCQSYILSSSRAMIIR